MSGMDRQARRDAVARYNAEGVAGLYDRPLPGGPGWLGDGEQATLKALILAGPDPRRHMAARRLERQARSAPDSLAGSKLPPAGQR
ncbi:helix-turn-helix domain-containing protein [Azospirillum sp. HJ39]|uniref:helix-turn-helix domain-containing protein n=1 Tax=Azospirillum sp. HJ39 TaxID=3159496 RepID=UPI003558421E